MDNGVLKKIYCEMLRLQVIEETIAAYYAEQEMRCPVHFCLGQEAVSVGVCQHLTKSDFVFSNHRSHGHYIAKGGNIKKMIAELYGKATGCCQGKGGSMHLIDLDCGFQGAVPIVGSTIPVATGAAFGLFLAERPGIVVSFMGDAATEEGVFHESLNFAKLKNLPIIYVCENNLYSVCTSSRERRAEGVKIHELAGAYNIPAAKDDGMNPEAVYAAMGTAVKHTRNGGGPYFLELDCYRWLEHCGPNPDLHWGYRTAEEFDAWKRRDPVICTGERMIKEGLLTQADIHEMRTQFREETENAIKEAKAAPFPEREMLMQEVYAS